MSEIIPIFPIDIVLYPNQKVPLKIFEPRYRQMLDDCMSSNRLFGICIIDGQNTSGGWASPVKTGTLVYIVKCEDLDLTGSNYYIELLGKKRFHIKKLITPVIEKPADYLAPEMPSMKQMLRKSAGEPLYFQASIDYFEEIDDNVDLKDWNYVLGKLELRIMETASKMGIEFENFTDFVISSGLKLESANVQDLYTLASMCSLSIESQQIILEANSSKEIIKILQKEI
ncbi:MAG: LON peptidase substrate-binding domain-containing protein [Candidatus Poseidoniales archaeon]|tara:strand:- start:25 stop:708 length:684 start_codon:yes stop_codon:yes gene_type:complete